MTTLDPHQIFKKVYDEATTALKVALPVNTNISLTKDEDSIVSAALSLSSLGAIANAAAPNTQVLIVNDAGFYSKARLYSSTVNNVTTGNVKLQASPVDSGDVWVDLETFSLIANNTTTISATTHNITARRLRAIVNTSPDAATTLYLVLGG